MSGPSGGVNGGRLRLSVESSISIGLGVLLLGGVWTVSQALDDVRRQLRAESEERYASKSLVEFRLDLLTQEVRELSAKVDRLMGVEPDSRRK